MKIIMNCPTYYNGKALVPGDKITIEDAVGRRWVNKGIATEYVKVAKEVVEDVSVHELRHDLRPSDLLGDDSTVVTVEQPEVVDEGKRTSSATMPRKNKSKQL